MNDRHTASTINDAQLDELYAENAELRDSLAHCHEREPRLRAEAAIERVRALHKRNENTGECEYCSFRDYPTYAVPFPCDTVRTLDGEEQ